METQKKDTAVRAVSPPSVYLHRSIRGTSHDASGEVFVFPLSPMSGKERKLRGRHSLTFFSQDDGLNNGGEMKMEAAEWQATNKSRSRNIMHL